MNDYHDDDADDDDGGGDDDNEEEEEGDYFDDYFPRGRPQSDGSCDDGNFDCDGDVVCDCDVHL